ncbi:MAG: DUF4139 domain-containing protein [Polyangiaceae bacterium]|nr:DUF4139 domain-containing protein [Polyangiaceae bacterium]
MASRVEAVTVYREGARVRRVAEVRLGEGDWPAELRVAGLPLCLLDDSVSARTAPLLRPEAPAPPAPAALPAPAVPVARDVRVVLDVPGDQRHLPPADDERLVVARREEARLTALEAAVASELALFGELDFVPRPEGADGAPPPAIPTAARRALFAFREREERALVGVQAELRAELGAARCRRQELEAALARESSARRAREHELRKTVVVALEPPGRDGASARGLLLVVEYHVPGARWAPSYVLRADRAVRQGVLELRALVCQATGEDWPGVRLRLSTAEAARFTELPELASLRIGRRRPALPKLGWRPPPSGAEELYADYDRARARLVDGRTMAPAPSRAVPATTDAPASPTAADRTPAEGGAVAYRGAHAVSASISPLAYGAARAFQTMPAAPPQAAVEAPASRERAEPAALDGGVRPVAPRDELLAYGRLRMPAARSPERGRLGLADLAARYLEDEGATALGDLDVGSLLEAAGAEALTDGVPPARHRFAWSEDYDYAYAADAPVDVPSDGTLGSVFVTAVELPVGLTYVTVPREKSDVYRLARLDNPLASPLLPGPVDVYVAGDFVVTSDVPFTPPRASLRLGLGVEQSIKVARNTRYREESKGLLGGATALRHEIAIDVHNHLRVPATLEVRERLPVARDGDDDVKVEVKELVPPWQPFEPFPATAERPTLKGGHRWLVELAPGGAAALRVVYEVRIASKNELVGGNRRED